MLSEYDPFRCLSVSTTKNCQNPLIIFGALCFCLIKYLTFQVIVPLLVTEDGRTLIICINCLTKVDPPKFICFGDGKVYLFIYFYPKTVLLTLMM